MVEFKTIKSKTACYGYLEAGEGTPMHFAHANGFPPGIYEDLIAGLGAKHHVYAMNFCCQAQCFDNCEFNKKEIDHWDELAEDLVEFLMMKETGPVIGVGHSLGGVVTMIASVKRPDLFRKIIMLDPVLLSPKLIFLGGIAALLRQRHRMPLAVRARKRFNEWDSREEALNYFKGKKLFEKWEERALWSYVNHGLVEEGGKFHLACPPECEARVFETFPLDVWSWVAKISVPTVLICAEHSDVLKHDSWALFGRIQPRAQRIRIGGLGHLFPMQKIDRTVKFIADNALLI